MVGDQVLQSGRIVFNRSFRKALIKLEITFTPQLPDRFFWLVRLILLKGHSWVRNEKMTRCSCHPKANDPDSSVLAV